MPHISARSTGTAIWLTGLSSAGKTTIAELVYEHLQSLGRPVEWLDGDIVRDRLSRGLGFSKPDRDENVRRIGYVAELLVRNGIIVLVSAISPYRQARDEVRATIADFVEVYVNAPLSVCESRDVKGLYRRARSGALARMSGLDDPYEPPLIPEVECRTDLETPGESANRVLQVILARGAARP